jgi:hypothetical protein
MTATGDKTAVYEIPEAREIEPIPSQQQAPHLYDWATLALAIAGIIAILGMFVLSLLGKPVPEGIGTLGGVALGALAGMVAVSRKP